MKLSFLLIYILVQANAWAASCCGGAAGGLGIPVIQTDHLKIIGINYLNTHYESYVSDDHRQKDYSHELNEIQEKFVLGNAFFIADYTQLGWSPSIVRNTKENFWQKESTTALSDFSLKLTQELFPAELYSSVRPRIFLSLGALFPFGRSKNNASKTYFTDAVSVGQYQNSLQLLLVKDFNPWQVSFLQSLTYTWNRNIINLNQNIGLRSPAIYSMQLRPSLSFNFEYSSIKVMTQHNSALNLDLILSTQNWADDSSLSVGYSNQQIMHELIPSKNSSLTQSLMVSFTQLRD